MQADIYGLNRKKIHQSKNRQNCRSKANITLEALVLEWLLAAGPPLHCSRRTCRSLIHPALETLLQLHSSKYLLLAAWYFATLPQLASLSRCILDPTFLYLFQFDYWNTSPRWLFEPMLHSCLDDLVLYPAMKTAKIIAHFMSSRKNLGDGVRKMRIA